MYIEDDEDFILAGNSAVEEEEETEEEVQGTTESEEEAQDQADSTEVEEEEEPQKGKKDWQHQALDSERAKRKQAERELKELKAKLEEEKQAKENENVISKERENYKKKMLEGDLIDEETADKLLDVFGEDIIKGKIASQKLARQDEFEKELSNLKRDEMFMDADAYKPQIREFMDKGLSAEEAYFASVGKSRFSQMKKDLEVEIEQKILNTKKKADSIDVGVAEAKGEMHKGSYTKREQEIARETGLTVEEVHKRSKMDSLDDFLKL